ncbi:hypothetical protein ACXR8U_13705 [Methylobacterium radiotolerans]|jgi:hypothetical protein|uniref:hypothetical protein n=1 Tax=Methylobacterium TaxID=407 RepID=UPI0005E645F6|nr:MULTISPECIES: hypothetical protein [Methylobacterium]MBN6824416.1 hypothetical protein [Methylobacterium organophilum]OXE40247.1 hypothetical protein CCS92_19615 [Methylobacterium radiotolerans]GAN49720.1 hypothetical protein ME121_3751 [Methylobacterium sp. ME121]
MAELFPTRLRCSTENWSLQNSARSGGQSFQGAQQFVASPTSRWRAKMTFHLLDDDDYLEARGFIAGLAGQSTPFLIGPYDYRGQPWNVFPITGQPITPDVAARNAAVSPGFSVNPDTNGAISFALAADAAMNATTIRISKARGGTVKRGQYLSIGDRLHVIVSPVSDPGPSGVVDIAVRPWLRADYGAGTPVSFDAPRCLMRLADGDTAAFDMTTSPLSDVTLDLIEAFV